MHICSMGMLSGRDLMISVKIDTGYDLGSD